MLRLVSDRALWRASFAIAVVVATAACARQSADEERAADSATALTDARLPVPVDSLPRSDTTGADSVARTVPAAPSAPGSAAGGTDARVPAAKTPGTPRVEPGPGSGTTRAPTTPERMDSARRAPRMPVPSRPNDATPSIPMNPAVLDPAPAGDESGGGSPDPVVARLEREARALASTSGCGNAGSCRVAPLGARACGGPRAYLAYCPLTTDSARLFRKLAELERAERAYNERSGMASICSLVTPPVPGYEGGHCTAGNP